MRLAALFILLSAVYGGIAVCSDVPSKEDLYAEMKVADEQKAIDRTELITIAPKDFKPVGNGAIPRFKLVVEKRKLRVGESIRYQVELSNIGSEPYSFGELNQSFFKTGRFPSDRVYVFLYEKGQKPANVRSPLRNDYGGAEIQFPPGLSEEEKTKKFKEMGLAAEYKSRLLQKLAPGETLHTRADGKGGKFRALEANLSRFRPGRYEFFVEIDPKMKTSVRSNTVSLELTP